LKPEQERIYLEMVVSEGIRTQEVGASNRSTGKVSYLFVKPKLEALVEQIPRARIIDNVMSWHAAYETIPPTHDYNGCIGRILLIKNGERHRNYFYCD
jgi:hypothetical protein